MTGHEREAGEAQTDTLSLMERVFHPLAGRSLLDVGCGAGSLCAALQERGARMTGIDPSVEAIDAARRNHPACRFLEGSAETLPFASGTFDGVVFLNSLHHVALMDAALQEAARVTAIGRPIVVVEPLTKGSFFSALLPIEDETAVRGAAQAAVDLALGNGLLRCLQVLQYDRSETFVDLDAFLARVLSADRRREGQIARKRREIETAFVQAARRDEGGHMSLVQPLRAHVLVSGAVETPSSTS